MRRFEIIVPASADVPFAMTVGVDAEAWLEALKAALLKLELGNVHNLLVDIHADNTIHVTEPRSHRTFRIRELEDEVGASTPPPEAEPVRLAAEAPVIGRARKPPPEDEDEQQLLLERLFAQAQDVWSQPRTLNEGAAFFLDLAMAALPVESGAVFISELERDDLYFAAARGPKANEVVAFTVPRGQGLVGFAVSNGVALAVSDADKDPRFFAAISLKLGYPTRSLAVAPTQKEGRVFGAIEVMNKSNDSPFTEEDLVVLDYLGARLADFLDQHFAQR